jgi:hypothetical protein
LSDKRYTLVETKWLEDGIDYTGSELRSHFVREYAGIQGDGVIAFAGTCDVWGEGLVDLEDAEEGSSIKARRMLHFIGEHFQCPLREGNFRLRLFATIQKEVLEGLVSGLRITRRGDDLFVGERKLTVAISTSSPTSVLFHYGINIDPSGAPVQAIGLEELGVDIESFAGAVLARYTHECESIEWALRKVRGVP